MRNTENTQAKKDLIKRLNLRAEFTGVAEAFGRKSNSFDILFDRYTKPFKFYGSVADKENGVTTLDDDALLFAYYCIISDAMAYLQAEDKSDFLIEFGYVVEENRIATEYNIDYASEVLSCEEFEQYKVGIKAWNGCKDTRNRLNKYSDDELYAIMDELKELEVN